MKLLLLAFSYGFQSIGFQLIDMSCDFPLPNELTANCQWLTAHCKFTQFFRLTYTNAFLFHLLLSVATGKRLCPHLRKINL
jgi:hypothetical protein